MRFTIAVDAARITRFQANPKGFLDGRGREA
jgi:hypothetical protein